MFKPFKGGKKEVIRDVEAHIPPVGYVYDPTTRQLEKGEILQRSFDKKEQYWERTPLPKGWRQMWQKQQAKQLHDPEYYDPEVAKFVNQEWNRRLKGVWFMNNGEPTYITGLHYFYLNWWKVGNPSNDGYPDFWESDKEFYYFMQVCIEDPDCLGMLYITKRREGKTKKSGVFLFEYPSRSKGKFGGVQSKALQDARDVVFRESVVTPFKHLPEFFRPVYDTGLGITPKSELRFFRPTKKGKLKPEDLLGEELESSIDWRSSEEKAYDGKFLHRYVGDEVGKTEECDVFARHNVVRFCCEYDGKFMGKMLYTTTVEELKGKVKGFKTLWEGSNQLKRNENNRTKTGLYRYFLPAYKALNRDKYGRVNEEANKKYYMNERASYANDPATQASLIRKNPFTEEEAFWTASDDCLFDAIKIQRRLSEFSGEHNLFDVGNFEWTDPDKREQVEFRPNKSGKFKIATLPDDNELYNKFDWRGGLRLPKNKGRFVIGCDPFDHDRTEDGKMSNAAAYVFLKFDALDPDGTNKFIVQYIYRPSNAEKFYDDILKLCHYFSCQLLFENQKPGIGKYFERMGYKAFLITPEGRNSPGIPSSKEVKNQMCDYIGLYVDKHCDKVPFPELLQDWIDFDANDTQRFDAAMASGYTLIAANKDLNKKKDNPTLQMTSFFKPNKLRL